MSSNINGNKPKLNGRASLYQHKPQRKLREGGLSVSQPKTVTKEQAPHKLIEVEADIALTGLKWLRENVHDPKTYGNGGVEDNILQTLNQLNEEMGIYFGTSHWGQIGQH